MAAKKVMLWPSTRSKFVKDKHMEILYRSLLLVALVMVVETYFMYSFMYAIKLALMVLVSIVLTIEMEILFYTHDKDVDRQKAKELIVKSYPKLTAIIYALLIPIGTPLWLVGLGAVLATLLGKLIFGGFAHQVFHSSLVGVIFVTLGWTQLVDSVAFMTSFDNYILELMFDNAFFNNNLSLGGMYDPADLTSALGMLAGGDAYDFHLVFLGLAPGITGAGFVLVGLFAYYLVKGIVNWITPTITIASFLVVALIATAVNGETAMYPLQQLFSGAFLFVVVFVVTDPITTPIPTIGKIIFGVVAGALTMTIRLAGTYEEGVLFAVLFMNMLTPLLNEVFKQKKKPVKKAVAKA